MKDNEALGVIRRIRTLCGVQEQFETGRSPETLPMWFHDDHGLVAVKMLWTNWLAFTDWLNAQLALIPREDEDKGQEENF